MNDFVSEDLVEVSVEGRKFEFKEMTGDLMDEMRNKTLKVKSDGGVSFDLAEQNKYWLGTVKKTPYKDFPSSGSSSERASFLNKLKKPLRDGLINKIRSYHDDLSDVEKK